MSDVEEVDGMAILAGPMAAVNARNKRDTVEINPEDPLRQDWKELTFTDSWNLPAVYDFGANESFPVTRALCKQHGGIDPAPTVVMTLAKKAAVERLCAEHWDAYRTYLNEAIATVRAQLREDGGDA